MFQGGQSCGLTLNHSSAESLLDDLMRRPGDTCCFRDSAVRSSDLHDEPVSPVWRLADTTQWNSGGSLLLDDMFVLYIRYGRRRFRCQFALIDTYSGSSMDGMPEPVVALHPLTVGCQWGVGSADLENWILARVSGQGVFEGDDHQIYICRTDAGVQMNTDESLRKQVDDNLRNIFGA